MIKRFFPALLAAILMLSCLPAFAVEHPERFFCQEFGMTFDTSGLYDEDENYVSMMSDGIVKNDPYIAWAEVWFYAMQKKPLFDMERLFLESNDEEEMNRIYEYTSTRSVEIADIIVSTADRSVLFDVISIPSSISSEVIEFATMDDYHYYFLMLPVDNLLDVYNDPERMGMTPEAARTARESIAAKISSVQSVLLERLRSAERVTPANSTDDLIGQTIQFETTDLDGNVVKSEELFRYNKITMINVWGTWCPNCVDEMAELARIHTRFLEKGCGIVGVEYEIGPIEALADTARAVMTEMGTNYPNVLRPDDHPIFSRVIGYPYTYFVDSEGVILTNPIDGKAVDQYEEVMDKLLAGETITETPRASATENADGLYRVYVYDQDGSPVKGALIQFCDDTTCAFQPTDADGVASFSVAEQKVYDVHVLQAPEGFRQNTVEYKTMDVFSDVTIILERE